jgi:hypothetical protein
MSGIMAMLMNNVAPRGDRTVFPFSKNVLIVYDLNSVFPNRYNLDPNPASLAATIAARETALGFTPTTITSYASFVSADISKYAHIWDLGYDTLMTTAAADKYKTYLQGGGAAFLLGENGFFVDRGNSIDNFINSYVGGGPCDIGTFDQPEEPPLAMTLAPQFLLANNDNTVSLNRPGKFETIGTATAMLTSVYGVHAAVWRTGSLSQAPTAAIASVLDINFLVGGNLDQNFIDNLSIVLNKI